MYPVNNLCADLTELRAL